MNILHLVTNYYPSIGGCQDLMRQISEGLVTRYDDHVTVLTTNALQSPHDAAVQLIVPGADTINGVQVKRFRYLLTTSRVAKLLTRIGRLLGLTPSGAIQSMRSGPVSPGMFRALHDTQADVVAGAAFPYIHMFYPFVAPRISQPPFVCYGLLHLNQNRPVESHFLRVIKRSSAYIALTQFERDVLMAHGIPGHKIYVISPGIHIEQFAHTDQHVARSCYGLGDAPVVGFIGRQAAYKGIDTLIHAMESIWRRIPETRLLIAGARTAYSSHLQQLIDALPEQHRAQIVNVGEFGEGEKAALYAACDVFASPSRDESFGIVYLEAWASRRPVIGADIGAVRSVIQHGHDGLLVPHGDHQALAAAVVAMLRHDRLRATMAERGYEKVRAQHTWEVVTAKVRSVYESVAR